MGIVCNLGNCSLSWPSHFLFYSDCHPCVGVKRVCWWYLYIFMVIHHYFCNKFIILRLYHPKFRCSILAIQADRSERTKWDFFPPGNYIEIFCRVAIDQLSSRFPQQGNTLKKVVELCFTISAILLTDFYYSQVKLTSFLANWWCDAS